MADRCICGGVRPPAAAKQDGTFENSATGFGILYLFARLTLEGLEGNWFEGDFGP
jgi:hypothetical protein